MKVERSKEWWLTKARQETGAIGADMSLAGCGACPICKHLWELYPDGKLPVHSDGLMGCAGSRQQPMPQCSRCGQYEMNHERHGSTGCPGVYPAPPIRHEPRPRCGEATGENTTCDMWRGHGGMHRPGER